MATYDIKAKANALREEVLPIFKETEDNIRDAEALISEINERIETRGNNSLEAVKENTKDKFELSQVEEFRNLQVERFENLLKEEGGEVYRKIEVLLSQELIPLLESEIKKSEEKVIEHWESIKKIDDDLNISIEKREREFYDQLVDLISYTDRDKHDFLRLAIGTYSYRNSFQSNVREGRY